MYALNIKKGTTIQNPAIGELPGGVAVPISEKQALIAKHLINVVVFDRVAGANHKKKVKEVYGVDVDDLDRPEEVKQYKDFVAKYKDVKIASEKWEEYKKGIRR